MARLLITASGSRALFCFIRSKSRSVAKRSTFFISGLSSRTLRFFICRRTISPVREISPTSNPLTPSTATISPFSNCWRLGLRKKSLRDPLLKLTSITLQALSKSAIGRLCSQSYVFIRLHPPVLQPPLLLHPPGFLPLAVPQLVQ